MATTFFMSVKKGEDKDKKVEGKRKKATQNAPDITVKVDATFEQIVLAGLNFNPKKKAQ